MLDPGRAGQFDGCVGRDALLCRLEEDFRQQGSLALV